MKNNQKGFTLIELIITMLVLVIVFGMLAGLVGFATRFYSDESSQVHRQEALRLFAVTFEKDVRRLVEQESYFKVEVSGDVTSYTLGDSSKSNIIRYDFNSLEDKVYRFQGASSTVVATDISSVSIVMATDISSVSIVMDTDILSSVSIVMDTVSTPFIYFEVIGIPDGRGTENEIDVVIYPRLLKTGG